MKNTWTLDKDALDTFLARLDPDRDRAAIIFERIRSTLLTFFRCNNCKTPEDLADETINRVMRRLDEINDLMPFIYGVARHVVSENHKIRLREVSIDEVREWMGSGTTESEDRAVTDKGYECLDNCLKNFDQRDRDLVLEYYRYDKGEKIENRKRMAEQMGISTDNLRVRAFRVRKLLEDCITKCTGEASCMKRKGGLGVV